VTFLGLTAEAWTAFGVVATAVGTVLSGVGLILTRNALKATSRATEMQVLEGVLREIRELDRQFIQGLEGVELSAWSATYFNTIEYLCFIVNRRLVHIESLEDFFFADALPAWSNLFDEHQRTGVLAETAEFAEFKRARKRKNC
jgi:hypothetical protein